MTGVVAAAGVRQERDTQHYERDNDNAGATGEELVRTVTQMASNE